jgi:hypothetical protein
MHKSFSEFAVDLRARFGFNEHMTTTKPKPKAVYLAMKEPGTKRTKHMTIYGASIEECLQAFGKTPTGKNSKKIAKKQGKK